LNDLTEQVQWLTREQRTLQDELVAARATINVLTRAAEAGPATELRNTEGVKIPDPEHFDGTRSKLPNFLIQLELKAASYSDEQVKLRLAVNYLREDAADQVRSYVCDSRVTIPNLAALIAILENVFGNPNRAAEAESNMSTI